MLIGVKKKKNNNGAISKRDKMNNDKEADHTT